MTTIAETLRGLPYFADLDDILINEVCARSETIEVESGTTIIEEGSLSEEMYVVVSGELEVTKKGSSRNIVLATLGPGEVVGEIALLDGAPRTASVTATTSISLIRIPAAAFEELISDSRVVRRMFPHCDSPTEGYRGESEARGAHGGSGAHGCPADARIEQSGGRSREKRGFSG